MRYLCIIAFAAILAGCGSCKKTCGEKDGNIIEQSVEGVSKTVQWAGKTVGGTVGATVDGVKTGVEKAVDMVD